jgi:DNA-binding MarR family transcriptional regulator
MADPMTVKVEEVLNGFTEVMSALMIDQYQKDIAELDLTFPQAQAMRILRRGPLLTGQLATQLKISAPAITQLTNRLIRKGLIKRTVGSVDRRCVIVGLSIKGRQLVDHFRRHRREVFTRALVHLSKREQAEITDALVRVVAALEDFEANARVEKVKTTAKTTRKNGKGGYISTRKALNSDLSA